MHALGDQDAAVALRGRPGHEHRLGQGAAAFVDTGVGDVHAGQLAEQRLVFEERLQAPLAGFGLISRIGGVVFAAAGDRIDHGGNEVIVTAAAEKADRILGGLVAPRQLLHVLRQFQLGQGRRHVERPLQLQRCRNGLKQIPDRAGADLFQHRLLLVGRIQNIRHSP